MQPTNRLRWLKVQHKDSPWADLKLQQWWEHDGGDYDGLGECRDVPIEVLI